MLLHLLTTGPGPSRTNHARPTTSDAGGEADVELLRWAFLALKRNAAPGWTARRGRTTRRGWSQAP